MPPSIKNVVQDTNDGNSSNAPHTEKNATPSTYLDWDKIQPVLGRIMKAGKYYQDKSEYIRSLWHEDISKNIWRLKKSAPEFTAAIEDVYCRAGDTAHTLSMELPKAADVITISMMNDLIYDIDSYQNWIEEDKPVIQEAMTALQTHTDYDVDYHCINRLIQIHEEMLDVLSAQKVDVDNFKKYLETPAIAPPNVKKTTLSNSRKAIKPNPFVKMKDLKCEEITITLMTDHDCVIKARGITHKCNFCDLGFRDGRKRYGGDTPLETKTWLMLVLIARAGGVMTVKDGLKAGGKMFDTMKSHIKIMNKVLKHYFGIAENPISCDRKKGAYRTKFLFNHIEGEKSPMRANKSKFFYDVDSVSSEDLL